MFLIFTNCVESVADTDPELAAVLLKSFYMDNGTVGADNVDQAIALQRRLHDVLLVHGFPLYKYESNSREFLERLDPSLIEPLSTKMLGGDEFVGLLGLQWYTESDELGISIRSSKRPEIVTKRVILSEVSRIFDILGVLTPVTIRGKLLVQSVWQEGRGWDEKVSDEIIVEFFEYLQDLMLLITYRMPRCYFSNAFVVKTQLIGFCDSSLKAYCAVIYLRSINNNGKVNLSFVCSKSRIAPTKPSNIHRLELSSAELLANLIRQVSDELKIEDIYCFCDSMVTLGWLHIDPNRLKVFVSNCVKKVTALTDINRWFYVDSLSNPADLGTRGISSGRLLECTLWKVGPYWLSLEDEFNHRISYKCEIEPRLPELRDDVSLIIWHGYCPILSVLQSYSSFYKCISVVGFVLRYLSILKRRVQHRLGSLSLDIRCIDNADKCMRIECITPLSIDERDCAYFRIILYAQHKTVDSELSHLCTQRQFNR